MCSAHCPCQCHNTTAVAGIQPCTMCTCNTSLHFESPPIINNYYNYDSKIVDALEAIKEILQKLLDKHE